MTEATNDTSATLRSYASMIDGSRIGMAYFLRKTADDIDKAVDILKGEGTRKQAVRILTGDE